MKHFFLQCLLLLLASTAHSQAVAWELSAQPGDQGSNLATLQSSNFNNCTLSRGAGVTATTGAGSMNASGWFSGTTPTTLANAIAGNDYYEFTINTTNCLFFNPTTIKIVLRSSATGPNTATLRCSSDGFTSDIGTVTVGTTSVAFTFSETVSPNSQSVTYRLYGYGAAAGGGTPSAGGTMRIGTSVVAADNDLEVFASTTFVSVSAVSNITVTDGDAVPATVFTANVPGATINWSRTPETIGLGPTSGTGNVPAFNAFNASGMPVTSTFTVNATVGSCTGPDMVFTITVNPAPCTITVDFFGNPSACNDNGTPNDPSDDFFTQNIHASFFNRPFTGSLQIVPGGDQIGTYSILANQIVGNSHTFNGVQLKADGTPSVVQMNFTDAPGCIDADTGPTVQPCSTPPPPCTITVDFFGNPSACNDNGTPNDPSDDFFTQNIHASFFNRPFTGSLQIVPGGDQIGTYSIPVNQIIGNAHTFNGVQLKADGTPSVVQMNFTDDPGCIDADTGPTVNACSNGAACAITDLGLVNPEPCDDNGTPNDPTDDFYIADLLISFENPPATGTLTISGADLVDGAFSFTIANVLSVGSPFSVSNKKFRADGQPTAFLTEFTDAPGCVAGVSTLNGFGPCSFPAPVLTCPQAVTVSCASQVPPLDPSSVSETHSCPGNVTITGITPEFITGQSCTNRFFINRAYLATDACGNQAMCSQLITVDDQTDPTMTCPASVTVSCASQVPPANIAAVTGVGDNCGGAVTVTNFPADVISNQACPNRFTITRSYFAVDACGNSNNCTQTIIVNDQSNPTMTCPAGVTVSCASQVPPANIAAVTGVGDNCGGAVTVTNFPGDVISNQTCPNRFTIARSYFAVDACGNSNNCTQTIIVNDQTPPSLTCPAAQTVSCAEQVPAPNPALVTGLSDNCGGTATASFISDAISNQTCANRFTVTRRYRATDACGNSASCAQIITVNDQTAPTFTFVPANVTVDCYQVPGVGIATASDNCTSGATVTFLGEAETPGACPPFKTLTRTWRATDACGNSATATQVVTVTDENAPQFLVLPKNTVVECGPDNAAELQAFLDNFGGALVQDCAEITYTHEDSPIQNNYFDCGNTFHKNIRFVATDECGNISFRDASFTVVDLSPPVFSTPPQNIELECDATDDNGENALLDWLESNAGLVAEDNCGAVELEKILVGADAHCGNTWHKTYEFRAADACGNLAKTTATFAVVDHTPPALDCPTNMNALLSCIEDLPAADPAGLTAWDCSPVTATLKDTWTNGSGCPGWTMIVAYRYVVADACGNEAECEQAYYVEESDTPALVCPDTVKLACEKDIPGPLQLFGYLKTHLAGACPSGFTSVTILTDSGAPQNGTTHRTYTFTAKTHCGIVTAPCTVVFNATGICNQLCTASQGSWGDLNGTIGGMSTADALDVLLAEYGPLTVGGGGHTVAASDAACVQEMLFGSGSCAFLPTGHYTCPLPALLANPDASLNNQLAANAMALQLNLWYNLEFNDRDLGIQDINNLPPCLVEYPLLKDLGQYTTVQDLLNLTNLYLQGAVGYSADMPGFLNAALDNLNHFRVDCQPNAPCERPGRAALRGNAANQSTAIRLFPNPAIDAVTLEFRAENEGDVVVKITDLRGVQTERTVSAVPGLNTVNLSLKNLPAGVYWLTFQNGAQKQTLRLVKMED